MCMCAKSLQSCLTLCDPVDGSPTGASVHGDSSGKSTGVSCHALFQGIFPTQGSNLRLLCLLHWHVGSLPLAPPGKPSLIHLTIRLLLYGNILLETQQQTLLQCTLFPGSHLSPTPTAHMNVCVCVFTAGNEHCCFYLLSMYELDLLNMFISMGIPKHGITFLRK